MATAGPYGEDVLAPLLEVRGITKAFGGLLALKEVSLTVRAGQIKGLIGPNGAGKTTLFNLITGILLPGAGDIRFRGRSIVGLRPHQAAEAGIARTFQNVQIFPGMTVMENILVGCHRHMRTGLRDAILRSRPLRQDEEAMHEKVAGLLETFRLVAWADMSADSLPFGLQRIVEMARALAAAPSLLLLDEPGSGLNPTEKAGLTDLIRRFRSDGVTVLLVEHDMGLIMDLADDVAVLDQGVLIAEGAPGIIQQNPAVIAAYLGEPEPTHAS